MKIATRASALALAQSNHIAGLLRDAGVPGVELLEIRTSGDKDRVRPLSEIGGLGVFTRELEQALLGEVADLAVHSLKDLPTILPEGLTLAGVPVREDPRDAWLSRGGLTLERIPAGGRVGTSSQRRSSQVLAARPDLVCVEIRGNVPTRIRKMDEGEFDAIVLAVAGLKRLGLADRITQVLEPEVMLPAISQGALGLEARSGDTETCAAAVGISHADTKAAVLAERALLRRLGGGCRLPIGGWGRIEDGRLLLTGCACSLDGKTVLRASGAGTARDPEALGRQVATALLEQGAAELLPSL